MAILKKAYKINGDNILSNGIRGVLMALKAFCLVLQYYKKTNIQAVRTSGDKSVSSLPPSSGTLLLFSFLATQWRELINFSPDVLTA